MEADNNTDNEEFLELTNNVKPIRRVSTYKGTENNCSNIQMMNLCTDIAT